VGRTFSARANHRLAAGGSSLGAIAQQVRERLPHRCAVASQQTVRGHAGQVDFDIAVARAFRQQGADVQRFAIQFQRTRQAQAAISSTSAIR
jgi:hypothetical protein